jgi:hypothetical protein
MKKLLTSGLIIFLLIQCTSCKKIISSVFHGLDVDVPEVQVTLPSVIAVTSNEVSLGSFSYRLNLDSIIRANTAGVFGINAVSSIKVKQIRINLTNPDQLNNLSNFESLRLTIQSDVNNSAANLITVNFPDAYASSITVNPVNSPDILPYLKGSEITNNVYGKMRRVTNKPLNMTIAITLRVN